MTTKEFGAYFLLMCKAWNEDPPCSIPSTDRVLARWARLSPEEWEECKAAVLIGFTNRPDGRLYHMELEQEFQKSRAITRRKSQAAKSAVESRWQKHRHKSISNQQLDTDVLPTNSERKTDELRSDTISQPQSQRDPPTPRGGADGVSAKRGGDGRGGSPLASVTAEELQDTGKLRERIRTLIAAGVLPDTENDRLMAVAAAERALAKGTNPPALWVRIVKGKSWDLLAGDEIDRARKRIADWKSQRAGMDPAVAAAVNRVADSSQGSEVTNGDR
jgi:uncharacterized protein YdaU (DUF1376 family)